MSDEPNMELVRQWTAALRSGKYKQTTGVLARYYPDGTSSHCCLGVLCDVIGDGACKVALAPLVREEYRSMNAIPPRGVRERLGLRSVNFNYLMGLNDDEGHTFGQIADYIDAHYAAIAAVPR